MHRDKKNIILFSPDLHYRGVPFALLSITRLLDRSRYDIYIITAGSSPDYPARILALCQNAMCFGLSCITGEQIKSAVAMSAMVRQHCPQVPIIWGGWQAITLPDLTLQSPYVDYICRGQGERTFFEFVTALETADDHKLHSISGLSYKNQDGTIVHNQWRKPESLDVFPDFDLELINWEQCLEVVDFGTRMLRIATSYGCPNRCGFCCEPDNSQGKWVALSAPRVVELLKKIRERTEFDALLIDESNFFVDEQRVADICSGLIENDFKLRLGQISGRTDTLLSYRPRTWQLMKQAGLYSIFIGAESANNQTLRLINKKATVEQTYALSALCHTYDIKLYVSVIFGLPIPAYFTHGSRSALRREFQEIRLLYKKLYEMDTNNRLLISLFSPLPHSPLYEPAVALGFQPPLTLEQWSNFTGTQINVPWLHKKDMALIRSLMYISLLLGFDFNCFAGRLPWPLRTGFNAYLRIARALCRYRLFHNRFELLWDCAFFYAVANLFNRLNSLLRFVNITLSFR